MHTTSLGFKTTEDKIDIGVYRGNFSDRKPATNLVIHPRYVNIQKDYFPKE